MGFLAPAVPWIIKGGAMLGSSLLGKKVAQGAQNAAMKRSPEEQAALTGAQSAATNLQSGGNALIKSGQSTTQSGLDTLQQPANYWSSLLGGNRAQMSLATSGARGNITDVYRGAERGIDRSGIRGAARDVAKADLNRQRAGQIAGLTTGQQGEAASNLAGIGQTITSAGTNTTQTGANLAEGSGNLFSNLLGQGYQNRLYGRQEGQNTGSSVGKFLFDAISGIAGSKMGGSKIPTIFGRNAIGPNLGQGPPSIFGQTY